MMKQYAKYELPYKLGSILITGAAIFIVDHFKVPNPANICLIGVTFATFVGGFPYGAISGFLTLAYCGYFFSENHRFFHYNEENAYKILVIFLSLIAMVFMVGTLKKKVDTRTKELETANQKLVESLNTDALTGICNYRCFLDRIENEWRRSHRAGSRLSVAMIDIDNFKKYNDSYGHEAGNECLKHIADIIKLSLKRPADFAARYGGEEFVAILPGTDACGAKEIMEEIRLAIEKSKKEHENSERYGCVTVSIGIASVKPENDSSYEGVIKKADSALYTAKQNGKNIVYIYEENNLLISEGSSK